MPVTTSAAAGRHTTPATARLVDPAGLIDPAEPADTGQRLEAGAFVWLDLQNPAPEQLRAFGEPLGLDEQTMQALTAPGRRPSFTSDADSVQAVVPSMNPGRSAGDILGIRVRYTGRFLLTTHPEPCPTMEAACRLYQGLPDAKKADGSFVLFFVLDQIVGSFEPDLVQVDARLDAVQIALLDHRPPGVKQELIKTRRVLSEAVQALGWYAGDLNHFLGASQLPGMNASAETLFTYHRSRVAQLREAAKDCREEAQDALGQITANVSDRQEQLINILTVVGAIFLPLTAITGYFGMNFDVLTHDLNTVGWFVGLGVLLPAASIVVSVVLVRHLIARVGVEPPR